MSLTIQTIINDTSPPKAGPTRNVPFAISINTNGGYPFTFEAGPYKITFGGVLMTPPLPINGAGFGLIQSGGLVFNPGQGVNDYYDMKVFDKDNTLVASASGSSSVYFHCYAKNTKILCNVDKTQIYRNVENIKIGDFVQTYKHGPKKVVELSYNKYINDNSITRIVKIPKSQEIFEDLYITGSHSILVDKLTNKELALIEKNNLELKKIDDKYLLLPYLNDKIEKTEIGLEYELYHLILENDDDDGFYGIYSNGLLTESMSLNCFNKSKNKPFNLTFQ